MSKIKLYFSLTKPGVLFGNVLSGIAGFLFAERLHFDFFLFLSFLIGITLVIGGACALNNCFDRDIDKKMSRTKNRAVASGQIKGKNAVIFSVVIEVLGLIVLLLFTNLLTTIISFLGFVIYVWAYGMYTKRKSFHGTLVGSISGAMPILAGYTAARGSIDLAGVLVFLSLFFWQFPEFYSISIYRLNEYKNAKIPVISVVKGISKTKLMILFYTIAFVISTLLLTLLGYTGMVYLVTMTILGVYWIFLGLKLLNSNEDDFYSRKMFKFSLIVLLVFCFMLSLNGVVFLP
jgi:protoheme IX farnesyltransferase